MIYNRVGVLPCTGFSGLEQSYRFIDSFVSVSTTNYRLKLIDKDGQYKVSPVLRISKRPSGFIPERIFPNPFTNELTFQFSNENCEDISVVLADALGKIVLKRQQKCQPGINLIHLEITNDLQPGIYLVKVFSSSNSWQQPLIKLR